MREQQKRREHMVREQIEARGVQDPLVLEAMQFVPREKFVSSDLAEFAYQDRPLPIPCNQTISQPYIVAFMIEALAISPNDKILEVGAGSGYASAIMAQIAHQVFSIERIAELAEFAQKNLEEAGYTNVHVRHCDGSKGWKEEAPFDAILVSAGATSIPKPLLDQLKIGGRMVIPVGPDLGTQKLLRITRTQENEFEQEELTDVRFVPLIATLS